MVPIDKQPRLSLELVKRYVATTVGTMAVVAFAVYALYRAWDQSVDTTSHDRGALTFVVLALMNVVGAVIVGTGVGVVAGELVSRRLWSVLAREERERWSDPTGR